MFELRIYGRRSSGMVRYRHGGLAAIVPVDQKVVEEIAPALTGTGDAVLRIDRPESAVVLAFPAPVDRLNRAKKGRPNGRSKGRPKG
jgi:hypothetical protein